MANICPKCGFENIDQTFYCSKCGAQIKELEKYTSRNINPSAHVGAVKAKIEWGPLTLVGWAVGLVVFLFFSILLGLIIMGVVSFLWWNKRH